MKKQLFPILFCIVCILLIGFLYVSDYIKNKPVNNETEIIEDKEEIVYKDTAYRMLDFDRRLILSVGQQEYEMCSVYSLAYARAILDNDYNADPYDYWEDEAVWRLADFDDIAHSDPLNIVLQHAYNEIDEGRPTILFTSGKYAYGALPFEQERISDYHFVLILGYRIDADYNNLKPSDFYCADAASGYSYVEEGYVPWVILTDDAPKKVSGEYSLYASNNKNKHVNTCIAYADTARWNNSLKEVIKPNYVDDNIKK